MPIISNDRLSVSQRLNRDGPVVFTPGGGASLGLVVLAGLFVAFGFVDDADRCLAAGVLEAEVFLGVLDLPDDGLAPVFLDDLEELYLSAMINSRIIAHIS